MNGSNDSYLVFTKNRPLRIAFIVDIEKSSTFKDVVSLIESMSSKWGGRYYQIIPSSSGKISKEWREYLANYDPDIINSYTKLTPYTIRQLNVTTNPLAFMPVSRFNYIESSAYNPVDILPDANSTAALWRNPIQNPEIISFEYNQYQTNLPLFIRNFIKLNLGRITDDTSHRAALTSANVGIKSVQSNTRAQFISAMGVLEQWNRRIYPSEYCMLPGLNYESTKQRQDYQTSIYIGNTVMDLIYYWNSALLSPDWLSTKKNSVWLPTNFLDNDDLLNSVKVWIYRLAVQQQSNTDVKDIKVYSSSLSQAKLQNYADKIRQGQSLFTSVERISQPPEIVYSDRISTSEEMDSFSVSGDKFTINVPPINLRQGGMGGQSWITDMFIEVADKNEYRQPVREFWLQYPKDNNLALMLTGRGIASRINREYVLSVPVNRAKESLRLTIEIPEHSRLVQSILLAEKNHIHYNGDLRDGVSKRPFEHATNSNAGRSLRGAISLFGDLPTATNFFNSQYWRNTFMTLAGSNPVGDPASRENLTNRIRKSLKKVNQPVTDKAVNAWVSTVTTYASELRQMTDTKPYSFFLSLLDEEIQRLNVTDADEIKQAKDSLRSRLSWLIQMKIFGLGIFYKCAHCGLKGWYSVNSIKEENPCAGCGHIFSLEAEEEWWYKLNSMIASEGGIYNQIPLIMALGELYNTSSSSFDYFMPVDVYATYSGRPMTDLDILAIVNGKLVIGEVKNSIGLFDDEEIKKLAAAAKRLKPDKVILFAPDVLAADQRTNVLVTSLKARIGTLEADVEWIFPDPLFAHDDLWSI